MVQRRWGRLALLPAAVLVAPGVLLAIATPAHASVRGGITSPTDGSCVGSHTTLTIAMEITRDLPTEGGGSSTLKLQVPGEASPRTLGTVNWSGNKQTFSVTLNTACQAYPGAPCSGVPARNGAYQVVLSGPVNQTRNFTVRVAPSPPANVRAEVTGQRQITVSWTRNPEPDIVSYDVFGDDGLVAGDLPFSTTSYVVDLPESGYGGDYTYLVRARRAECPGASQTCTSPLSNAASASVSEPTPEPEPSDDPTEEPGDGGTTDPGEGYGSGGGSGGGSNGGSGGTGSGGSGKGSGKGSGTGGGGGDFSSGTGGGGSGGVAAPDPVAQQRKSFGLTFKSFSPKLGAPKLPPLPQFAEVEEPDGTFDPTIDYGDQEVVELAGEESGTVQAIFEDVVSTVFEGRRFWTSLSLGLLLMLSAGHVRVWLGGPEQQ